MKVFLLSVLLLLFATGYTQNAALPAVFNSAFKSLQLDKKYEPSNLFSPGYFQGDFNGDGVQDIAILVTEKSTNKFGVMVIHGRSDKYFVFGAGTKFEGAASDNLGWANRWSLYTKDTASELQFDEESGEPKGHKTTKLLRPGLLIEDNDDGETLNGGIIYWTGEKYVWIEQGKED